MNNAGTIAHLAMQAWTEADEWNHPDPGVILQNRFDEVAARAGVTLSALPNAVITRARLKTRGRELAEILAESGGRIQSELLLADEKAHLFGILDIVASGGSGLVIDLKTGHNDSTEAGSSAVAHQMTFYAHLFAATYGALPAKIVIFSLRRGAAEIKVGAADIASLLRDLQAAQNEQDMAATPGQEICRFCSKRTTCEPHWRALSYWTAPDAIEGLIGKIERATSGTVALLIADEWLTGIPEGELPRNLQPGKFLRAVRVRRLRGVSPVEWAATRFTKVQISSRRP